MCVTPALPLSHKEISVAEQKAELGSGANGYYMDPGRERDPAKDHKLGSTPLGSAQAVFLDITLCVLTILVIHLGRSRDRALI